MLVLAHRGYHAIAPENSYDAFDAAIKRGADGIETDVRVSADGKLILRHDRLAPDGREVSTMTRDELSRAVGHEVPTVMEALERQQNIMWNLEIKAPEAVEPLRSLLEHFRGSVQLLITSFWHKVALECAEKMPVACGFCLGIVPPRSTNLRARIGVTGA
jgi:glycerophosphoryl diester phosphodiesterase